MAKNVGKLFEDAFKESVPNDILYHRLPDSAQSFNGSNNLSKLRFSRKNPCDVFLFDGIGGKFYALELKTVSGKSISFERTKDDKGEIHFHQIEGLRKFAEYNSVVSGFVINFRNCDNITYFIPIDEFINYMNNIDKKSININDIKNMNVINIGSMKKITRYTYDILKFIECFR